MMRNVLNSTLNETAALHRRKKKLTLLVAFLGLMVAISVSFALSRSGFTLDGDAAVSAGGPASTAGETAGSAPASAAGETSGADATQTSAAGETAAGGPASTAGETAGSAPASAAGETDGTDATQTSAAGETAGGGPASTAGETAGSDPASAAGETSGADTTQTSAAGETAAGDAAPSAGEVDGASPAPAGEEPDGVAPAPAAEEPLPGGPALAEQAPNETQMNGLPPVGIVPLDAPLGVGFSSDLRDFVVSPILITDSHGNPVTDSQGNPIVPFDYNGRYDFFITFSEQNLLQFAYDNDVNSPTYGDLYYQLPHELRVVQAVTDKPIYSSTNPGVQIGTYSMDMSGLVTVHMDDVQNNGQPAMKQVVDPETGEMSYVPENFIDFYSNAKITLWLTSEFAKYGDAFAIDFGNGVSITVLVNNSTEPTLAVSKSLLSFDPLSKKAVFSVNFTAKNGPINNINLRDQLVIDGTSINPAGLISNVTVAPNTLTAGAISYEGDAEQHFNIPLTGALAQDATATVNYTVDLTSVINAGDP
ncbi:MAG: hypothetical protein FWC60_09060, partial [Firmicutes bacterium]|nr:hypothetical protein [Bacillota bacterium]